VRVHSHECQRDGCTTQVECCGDLELNDGEPWIICKEFHMPGGYINSDFICDECEAKREAEWQKEQAEADVDITASSKLIWRFK
jgi:hypothetical protein